jgi:hypothetical protein
MVLIAILAAKLLPPGADRSRPVGRVVLYEVVACRCGRCYRRNRGRCTAPLNAGSQAVRPGHHPGSCERRPVDRYHSVTFV